MKFAFSMLLDFVQTQKSAEEVGALLTMAGFEVEGIDTVEDEKVLDIKVMSNRGDGLSVLGLAREVLAKDQDAEPTDLYRRAAERFPRADSSDPAVSAQASVQIDTEENCTRYACRVFEGTFDNSAPERIQKRLRVAGMRSVGLLVDLTNYVMLELGQPLHAFDLDMLHGQKIIVRKARPDEKLTTLDGKEHLLKLSQMMVCDADRPVAAAGIMGGLETEVTSTTSRILLEAAHFVNTSVRRTRKEMNMSTEASYRFERSVDPEGVVAALNRFSDLLEESDPSSVTTPGVIDLYPRPASPRVIQFRPVRASILLGMHVSATQAKSYLERLGFGVNERGGDFEVTVPTWRPDVEQEYDLIEEVARVHGYEAIPETPIHGTTTQGGVFGLAHFLDAVREKLLRQGFVQNISHSLRDIHPLDDPDGERVGPRQPGSPEIAWLRNSIWPNLADNARRNGGQNLFLFEIGSVFGNPTRLSEVKKLGVLASGTQSKEHWEKQSDSRSSFFSLKGVVEEVLRTANVFEALQPSEDPRLHPARQGLWSTDDHTLALIGQIHPDVAEQLDLSKGTYLAEVDLELLYRSTQDARGFKPVSRNPAVRRDIAILIDKTVNYATIERTIAGSAGDLLEKQWLFDVYEGRGIPEGKHSLAIALQLRKFGENLTDSEANQVRDQAVQALAVLGATQR